MLYIMSSGRNVNSYGHAAGPKETVFGLRISIGILSQADLGSHRYCTILLYTYTTYRVKTCTAIRH